MQNWSNNAEVLINTFFSIVNQYSIDPLGTKCNEILLFMVPYNFLPEKYVEIGCKPAILALRDQFFKLIIWVISEN